MRTPPPTCGSVPNLKEIIEEKYLPLLSRAFEHILGFSVNIKILCDSAPNRSRPVRHAVRIFPRRAGEEQPGGGDYEYTFSTFIVGPSTNLPTHPWRWLQTLPMPTHPLFIYGGSGLGKTHLLLAICAEIKKNKPETNIIYAKGEEFTNELIYAITTETTREFHDKYRLADVLLVDDIQFIGGKESTQEEFPHL